MKLDFLILRLKCCSFPLAGLSSKLHIICLNLLFIFLNLYFMFFLFGLSIFEFGVYLFELVI